MARSYMIDSLRSKAAAELEMPMPARKGDGITARTSRLIASEKALANVDEPHRTALGRLVAEIYRVKAVLVCRGRTETTLGKHLETCHMQAPSLNRARAMQSPSTNIRREGCRLISQRDRWRSVADLSCRSMVTRNDLARPK